MLPFNGLVTNKLFPELVFDFVTEGIRVATRGQELKLAGVCTAVQSKLMMTLDVTYSFTHLYTNIAARKVSNYIQISALLLV